MLKKSRKLLTLMLSAAMIGSLLAGCGNTAKTPSTEEAAKKDTVVVNLVSDPKTIDPALNTATDGSTVIFNIFEGLVRVSKDNTPEPGLAENWDISNGGKKYVFHLRDGLKFSDGSPITAENFKYAIMRVLNPETASPYANHIYAIKNAQKYNKGTAKAEDVGVKVVDDKTLEVELDYPVPYFLDVFSYHLLMPLKQDVVEANKETWATDPKTLIGNGPFKLAEWKHNDYMLLEKNPNYWDADNVKVDKIKFVMINDENTSLTAFKTGKVDLINNLPAAQLPSLIEQGKVKSVTLLGPYFYAVNVQKKPFDDARVRKALSLAIDREAIINTILQGNQKVANGFIPYGIPGTSADKDFRTESGKDYINKNADVEQAKKLLAEAGFKDGKGFPKVNFVYNTSESHKAVAEAVQAMWKKNLGIDVNLSNQEWKVFITTRDQGQFDIARHGYIADFNDPGSLFDLFVTGNANNNTKYSNKEYDNLVLGANKEENHEKRMEMYHKAEDILMNDMPGIPLYYYDTNYMLSDKVKGVNMSPLGWIFLRTAEIVK